MSLYVLVRDLGEELAEYIDRAGTFTDARPSRPKLAMRQVALVSFEGGAVNAVGRMTRGQKVASLRWGLRVDELVVLDDPLPLETLTAALPEAIRETVRTAFARQGAQLDDNVASLVLDAIAELEPWLEDELRRLRRISAPLQSRRRVTRGEPIVAFERDAVASRLRWPGSSASGRLRSQPGTEMRTSRTDIDWMTHLTSLFGWMTPGETKTFPLDQQDEAIRWVAEQ